jgi:TPR repeat protein
VQGSSSNSIYPHSHVLIIGIDDYAHVPRLNYAVNDAQEVKQELASEYGFSLQDIKVLTNAEATKAKIEAALHILSDPKTIGRDDRIIVFFAGHGTTVQPPSDRAYGFLIPVDGNPGSGSMHEVKESCISLEDVWAELDGSPANHVLVIADSCFSGLLVSTNRSGYTKVALGTILAKRARQAMCAGTANQKSNELPEVKHGAFTYWLLKTLKARAKAKMAFTASDMFPEIRQGVLNLSEGKQVPIEGIRPNTEGDVVFIPNGAKVGITTDSDLAKVGAYQEGLRANRESRNEDALRLMSPFASKGDARALVVVGRAQRNRGDYAASLVSLQKATELGDPLGAFYYGDSLAEGLGVPIDAKRAAPFLEKALKGLEPLAQADDSWACQSLAFMYLNGLGTAKDPVAAAKCFQKAADLGEPVSMWNLGDMYRDGTGVEPDLSKAATYFQRSADAGYAKGYLDLGRLFENGQGVKRSYEDAANNYRKAADSGIGLAMLDLGDLYRQGLGVKKDPDMAWGLTQRALRENLDAWGGRVYFPGYALQLYIGSETSAQRKQEIVASLAKYADTFKKLSASDQESALTSSQLVSAIAALPSKDGSFAAIDTLDGAFIDQFANLGKEQRKQKAAKLGSILSGYLGRRMAANEFNVVVGTFEKAFTGIKLGECTDGEMDSLARDAGLWIRAYQQLNKSEEAAALLKDFLAMCDTAFDKRPWDFFLKNAYMNVCFDLAADASQRGQDDDKKRLLSRAWSVEMDFFGREDLLEKYADLPLKGQAPKDASPEDAVFFRSFGSGVSFAGSKIERVTWQARFNGVKAPYDFYLYHGLHGYKILTDQLMYLKEFRSGVVAPIDRQAFSEVNYLARENKIDYYDLFLYCFVSPKAVNAQFDNLFKNEYSIITLTGKNPRGEAVYCCVKVAYANLAAMGDRVRSGRNFNPELYGKIVAAGKGMPTPEVKAELCKLYPVFAEYEPIDEYGNKVQAKPPK